MSERKLSPASVVVEAGRPSRRPGEPLNTPISLSSAYHSGGDRGYLREGSPTTDAFEAVIGALDGGVATSFASGVAAFTAVLDGLPTGAVVVAPSSMYWGSVDLLRAGAALGRFSVRTADIADTDAVLAVLPGADLLWIETPTNPLMALADVPAICAAARAAGVRSGVDATFTTPLRQRPLEQGADLVMHSATKYLAGHSDALMGVLVTADAELSAALRAQRSRTGAMPGALESFLALRGVRTLDVRLRRQEDNARELAARLAAHPAVARVRYPGLPGDPGFERARRLLDGPGAMLALELVGGPDAADRLCERLELITHATSLGGVESLLERRGRYAGEQLIGTPAGLLRFSVGIEDVDDLWADLDQAL
jgi:cystathionine gamma-synthase